jgi:nucleotide-binding universal stress UspA family protein
MIDASYEVDVELIVIGVRRRSPVGKLFLGSTAQRVILEAGCPVTAVKADVGPRI